MSGRTRFAVFPLLLLTGFALRHPWGEGPEAPNSAGVPAAGATIPAKATAIARSSAESPESDESAPTTPVDDEYADDTVRQFAAEPALIDLIEDQALDPDAEVREEAGATLALGFVGSLDVPADGDPPLP